MEIWGRAEDGATVRLTLRSDLGSAMLDRWPELGLERVAPRSTEPDLELEIRRRDDEIVVRRWGEEVPGGFDRVESDLALFAADRLRGAVAIHAAVIERRGRLLLVPGPSLAGKSSLSVAAHDAGAAVLSDEFALVDVATGLVSGWKRPVRRRRVGGGVDRLDIVRHSPPLPVGLVAVLQYRADGPTGWSNIARSEAVLKILENTVCARTRPMEAFDVACALARAAPTVSGTRGEAAETIDALLEQLDETSE